MLYYKKFEISEAHDWVVFIHGAGGSSSVWYKQLREFKKEFNVLLVDLRGHGNSKHLGILNKEYSMEEVSLDVVEVLDHLDIKYAHFVGISLGTILIRTIADLHPSRVRSMVMGGAVIRLNTRVKFLMKLGNLVKRFIPYMWLYRFFAWCLMPKKRHRKSRLLFVKQAKKLYQKEFNKWFKLTKGVVPFLLRLEETDIDIPSMYIMGEEDYMFLLPVEEVVKKSKHAELEVIKNSGHVCNVDQPNEFNQISIEFIKRISATTC